MLLSFYLELEDIGWSERMNWKNAKEIKPPNTGVYWVQSRDELGHIQVRYQSCYWNGYKWMTEPGAGVYFWAYIEQAPEPDGALYYDELGRLDIVPAQEIGVDLHTPIGKDPAPDRELPENHSYIGNPNVRVTNWK